MRGFATCAKRSLHWATIQTSPLICGQFLAPVAIMSDSDNVSLVSSAQTLLSSAEAYQLFRKTFRGKHFLGFRRTLEVFTEAGGTIEGFFANILDVTNVGQRVKAVRNTLHRAIIKESQAQFQVCMLMRRPGVGKPPDLEHPPTWAVGALIDIFEEWDFSWSEIVDEVKGYMEIIDGGRDKYRQRDWVWPSLRQALAEDHDALSEIMAAMEEIACIVQEPKKRKR